VESPPFAPVHSRCWEPSRRRLGLRRRRQWRTGRRGPRAVHPKRTSHQHWTGRDGTEGYVRTPGANHSFRFHPPSAFAPVGTSAATWLGRSSNAPSWPRRETTPHRESRRRFQVRRTPRFHDQLERYGGRRVEGRMHLLLMGSPLQAPLLLHDALVVDG